MNYLLRQKISWDHLVELKKKNLLGKIKFYRDQETQKRYEVYQKELLEKNKSQEVVKYKELFEGNNKNYKIMKNNFPYFFDDNIDHKILWFNPYSREKWKFLNDNFVNNILKNEIRNEYIFFKNDTSLQSIPKLIHYHVLVKKI